jgi:raffinose/stachyose/melibiose transport system permease protein
VIIAPCYFLFIGSFKTVEEFFSAPFSLPESWGLTNYKEAWKQAEVAHSLLNSFVVTVSSVLLGTAVSCLASYAIARRPFRGSTFLLIVLVSGLFIPVQVISLAVFIEMRQIGLLGTILPMIIMYSALGVPLGVIVLVGFFRAIPRELSEAAAIDGAGPWQIFWEVVLPLARAPLMTVAILNGVWIWNDFYLPLLFSIKSSLQTLPVAILNFFGVYSTQYGYVFAGVVISAIPVIIIYVLMTRRFIAGVTAGSVKG